MALSFTGRKRVRKNFGRIPEVTTMPNLIEVQKTSYAHFLQMDVSAEQRTDAGLQEVFKSVSRFVISRTARSWTSSATNSIARNMMSRNASSAA